MPEEHGLVQQQGFRRHDRQANSHRAVLSRLQHRDLRVLHLVLVHQSHLDLKTASWHDVRCVWPGRFFYVYLRAVMGVPYRVAFRIPSVEFLGRRCLRYLRLVGVGRGHLYPSAILFKGRQIALRHYLESRRHQIAVRGYRQCQNTVD